MNVEWSVMNVEWSVMNVSVISVECGSDEWSAFFHSCLISMAIPVHLMEW